MTTKALRARRENLYANFGKGDKFIKQTLQNWLQVLDQNFQKDKEKKLIL